MHLITKQDNEAAFVFNLIWTELIPACLSLVYHPSCSAHSAKCYTWPCQPPPLRRSSKGREGNLISAQIKIPTSHQLCNSRLGYRQHLVNYSPPFDIKYDSKTRGKNNAWQDQILFCFWWNSRRKVRPVEAFRMGVFRSIIMSRNHFLVNAKFNSETTNWIPGGFVGHQMSFASPRLLMELSDHPKSK